jgi:cellulose synthase/poly-beta-1,6-N-acetylglucosamine synthase-like glycosyltransferase
MASIGFYFFYAILSIAVFRLCTWIILSLVYNFKEKVGSINSFPLISLIVPSFNEETTIRKSIKSLIDLDYPNYEIIVVDDGSTDKTLKLAREFESSNVKVIHQHNQGKANALNNGINNSKGEIILTVDADTKLRKDSLKIISARFAKNKQIGAVAGNVKVIPEQSILNIVQGTEYTVGINLVRKAQSTLGCVMIVPGPIAALRREAIEKVEYFSNDTFAEDFDITMEVLKQGYKVEYEDDAISYTDAPKNLEDFIKQRRRWYRGMYQVLDKHRNLYLSIKHGLFGVFGVPNLWFDAISPFFNTALILLTLITVFLGDPLLSLSGITLYFVIQFAIGIFAVSLDPQPRLRDFLGIPLLLFHNVFLDGVRLMSFTEETINVFMKWEKPKR